MATENTVQLYLIGFYKDLITSLAIQYKVPKRSNCFLMSLNVNCLLFLSCFDKNLMVFLFLNEREGDSHIIHHLGFLGLFK